MMFGTPAGGCAKVLTGGTGNCVSILIMTVLLYNIISANNNYPLVD
jgi:hypothetical protein